MSKSILKSCDVEGCVRKSRTPSAQYCETHYYRLRRTGSLEVEHPQRDIRGICTVDGCGNIDTGPHGYCSKHYTRVKRHGDASIVRPIPAPRGEDNPNWRGTHITVKAAHMRVTAVRGPARKHSCVDCGGTAAHWSYDHEDAREMQSAHGPYSADIKHYQARCVSCHKVFDMARFA